MESLKTLCFWLTIPTHCFLYHTDRQQTGRCTHTHTCMHECMYTNIHTHTHTHTHTYKQPTQKHTSPSTQTSYRCGPLLYGGEGRVSARSHRHHSLATLGVDPSLTCHHIMTTAQHTAWEVGPHCIIWAWPQSVKSRFKISICECSPRWWHCAFTCVCVLLKVVTLLTIDAVSKCLPLCEFSQYWMQFVYLCVCSSTVVRLSAINVVCLPVCVLSTVVTLSAMDAVSLSV